MSDEVKDQEKKEAPKPPGFWKSLVKAIRSPDSAPVEERAAAAKEGAEELSKKIEQAPAVGKAVMPRDAIERKREQMRKIDSQLEEGSK